MHSDPAAPYSETTDWTFIPSTRHPGRVCSYFQGDTSQWISITASTFLKSNLMSLSYLQEGFTLFCPHVLNRLFIHILVGFFFFFFFFAIPLSMWDLSSPARGFKCPLQWKLSVLTTRPPGNSLICIFKYMFTDIYHVQRKNEECIGERDRNSPWF